MDQELDPSNLRILAGGSGAVTVVDDLFTGTERNLGPGEVETLMGAGEGEPGHPAPGPGKPGGPIWKPDPLPLKLDDNPAVIAEGEERPRLGPRELSVLESGDTLTVRLEHSDRIVLSDVSEFVEAAYSTPGRVVIELDADG